MKLEGCSMVAQPKVTICVPVFNGVQFVTETLRSIARQTYPDMQVLISDDASTDGSVGLCRRFVEEHKYELLLQPQRRGWIENCNLLLAHARGDYVCIVPQDDVLGERYVEALASHLSSTPKCVQAFCDVRAFGTVPELHTQSSLVGSPFERLYRHMTQHFDGTAFRGLIRRDALDRAGGLLSNAFEGFAADVAWTAHLAWEGEIHRVQEVLYFKRFHRLSTHFPWFFWDQDTKIAAWTEHCAHLLGFAFERISSAAERWVILHAAVRRLIMANEQRGPYPEIRHLPFAHKVEMVDGLLARFESSLFTAGASHEERRRVSVLIVEALSAENLAAIFRTLHVPESARAPIADTGGAEPVVAPRTPANLYRFLLKKPPKLSMPDPDK
jgi:GT2 family glycosyltransferase